MPEAPTSPDARHLEMISAMTECAFELGLVATALAKRAGDDTALFLKATAEFQRCFFAVRMGIRLRHWGVAGTGAARAASPADAEHERPEAEHERPEAAERPDCGEARERVETDRERDREGDYEPVSLPRFLKSLGLVAASAEQRQGDLPPHIRDTTLPTLRNLLRQANAPPDGGRAPGSGAASAVAVLVRPPAAPAGRSRLLTSTVTPGVAPLSPTLSRRRPSG